MTPMRILLIMPDAHMHKLRLGPFTRSFREAPLTLTTLAALAPPGPGVEIKLVDGSVDAIPLNYPADLVGISVITGCARPAYALAAHFRRRGIPVVLGGVHVTILPGEAMQHADSIVVGRGEHAWPQLIEDFRQGRMQRVYRERPLEDHILRDVPVPRRAPATADRLHAAQRRPSHPGMQTGVRLLHGQCGLAPFLETAGGGCRPGHPQLSGPAFWV